MALTPLTRPITRKVATTHYGAVVVRLTPEGLTCRQRGRRTEFGPLPFGWLYQRAVQMTVDARREKGSKRPRARRGKLSRG